VEAGDVPVVSALIKIGARLDGNTCMANNCPIPLTPLQFAGVNTNLQLLNEIIIARARIGAKVDDYEPGWKCSVLVLAIHGYAKPKPMSKPLRRHKKKDPRTEITRTS
jgi:hypothetical protein